MTSSEELPAGLSRFLDPYVRDSTAQVSGSIGPYRYALGDQIQPIPGSAPFLVRGRAHGGFGAVYFIESLEDGWRSALKCPRLDLPQSAKTLNDFEQEALNWTRLPQVPLLLPAYRVLLYRRIPHVHIEYVEPYLPNSGSSLGTALRHRKSGLDLGGLTWLGGQIVQVMSDLEDWNEQFSHGDIKPDNILLKPVMTALDDAPRLDIRLTDFGLCRYRAADNAVAGDIYYLPPEVLTTAGLMRAGEAPLRTTTPGQASTPRLQDIYAVGCTFFEMATGRMCHFWDPEEGRVGRRCDDPAYMRGVIGSRSDLNPSFWELVDACLNWDPEGRPQTFSAVRERWLHLLSRTVSDRKELSIGKVELRGSEPNRRAYPGVEETPVFAHLVEEGHDRDLAVDVSTALLEASNRRASGRIEESIEIYDSILEKLDQFGPALAGIAHVLALQGRVHESIRTYFDARDYYLSKPGLKRLDALGWGALCASASELMVADALHSGRFRERCLRPRIAPHEISPSELMDSASTIEFVPVVAMMLSRDAVKALPESGPAHRALGGSLLLFGDVRQALSSLETAERLDPGHPNTRTLTAICRVVLGQSIAVSPADEAQVREMVSRLGLLSVPD